MFDINILDINYGYLIRVMYLDTYNNVQGLHFLYYTLFYHTHLRKIFNGAFPNFPMFIANGLYSTAS